MPKPAPRKALSIAESLELLRLSMPADRRSLAWWSDADYALAGAHLIDLSFAGAADTDLRTVTIASAGRPAGGAEPQALKVLRQFGGSAPLDVVLEEIVARIGDLRGATLASLAAKTCLSLTPEPIDWGFVQHKASAGTAGGAEALRASLNALIEGDDLPEPEQAALVSILQACGMIGQALAGQDARKWLARHGKRVEAIHRMDLVGQSVSAAISRMRERLRTYVLRSDDAASGKLAPKKKSEISNRLSGAVWEWRCFWPAGAAVALPETLGLIAAQGALPEEENADTYLFVHGKRDNIKFRGKGLKVKPVIEAFDEFCAFAPSRKIKFPERAETLAEIFPRFNEVHAELRSREELVAALAASGYRPGAVEVTKTRRQYSGIFGVAVELALIGIGGRPYLSLAFESHFLTAVRVLARNVPIGHGIVGGYSEVLERVAMRG